MRWILPGSVGFITPTPSRDAPRDDCPLEGLEALPEERAILALAVDEKQLWEERVSV